MSRNTWKKGVILIILAALIATSLLAATINFKPITTTYPTTIAAKTNLINVMYLKNGIPLYNSTGYIGNPAALLISPEQTNINSTIYYYFVGWRISSLYSAQQGVSNVFLYLSVALLLVGLGLTAFYYVRRRRTALASEEKIEKPRKHRPKKKKLGSNLRGNEGSSSRL